MQNGILNIVHIHFKTRCVCETQVPPIIGNSKDGQSILIPPEISHHKKCMKAIICYDQCQFKIGQMSRSKGLVTIERNTHVNYENSGLELTVEKLLTRFKFSKK